MQIPGQYPNSLQKWENEVNNKIEPNFFQNNSTYDFTYKFTKDPKLLWFQYRINHRILATNYLQVMSNDTYAPPPHFPDP